MESLITEVDETVGIGNVHYLHLNDSKQPCGSEKDEHEHIGEGEIREEGFRQFINHHALKGVPMVVETPEDEKGDGWNIERVKELRREA
jgi:deoxyribonuclease-4